MFKSNMSKNTVGGNCMTNKIFIVMFSTNPAIGKKYTNEVKKKRSTFFLYLTGFETATSGFLFSSLLCV